MNSEKKEVLSEEFDLWLRTRFADRIWIQGHLFEKRLGGGILIDGGLFTVDEAKTVFQMLTSRNPLDKLNANIIIWDRNGTLVKILVVLAVIALIIVYVWVKR